MQSLAKYACLTLAGLPMVASAHGVTLQFSADRSEVNIGDTVNWVVSASFTGFADPSAYFGGFNGSFVAALPGSAQILSTTNLLRFEGTPPSFDGATINDVNIFQAALLSSNDNANPIDIFAFEMRALKPVGLNWFTGFDAVGVATIFPDDGIFAPAHEFIDITVFSDGLVPSPGTAGVFVLIGLGSAGRRRPA